MDYYFLILSATFPRVVLKNFIPIRRTQLFSQISDNDLFAFRVFCDFPKIIIGNKLLRYSDANLQGFVKSKVRISQRWMKRDTLPFLPEL